MELLIHLEYMRPVEDGPVTMMAADKIYPESYSSPSVLFFLGDIRFFSIYLPYILFLRFVISSVVLRGFVCVNGCTHSGYHFPLFLILLGFSRYVLLWRFIIPGLRTPMDYDGFCTHCDYITAIVRFLFYTFGDKGFGLGRRGFS